MSKTEDDRVWEWLVRVRGEERVEGGVAILKGFFSFQLLVVF